MKDVYPLYGQTQSTTQRKHEGPKVIQLSRDWTAVWITW